MLGDLLALLGFAPSRKEQDARDDPSQRRLVVWLLLALIVPAAIGAGLGALTGGEAKLVRGFLIGAAIGCAAAIWLGFKYGKRIGD